MAKKKQTPREHVWTVLSIKHIIEIQTQKISLIEIPERLILDRDILEVAAKEENVTLRLGWTLASMFWSDGPSEESAYRVDIVFPDGTMASQEPITITGKTMTGSTRVLTTIEGIPFRGAGTYYFEVRTRPESGKRWRRVAKVPLQIVFKPEESKSEPDQPAVPAEE